MAEYFTNLAASTLNGGITDVAVSLAVAAGGSFPASGDFRIRIDTELILVGSRSGDTLSSLTRGIESTVAAAHADGAAVTHLMTAGTLGAQTDPTAGTPGLRSLGTGSQQAAAGDDSRFGSTYATGNSAGENLTNGDLVSVDDSASPYVFKADANGTAPRMNAIGFVEADVTSGQPATVKTGGIATIPADHWEGGLFPSGSDAGKIVYMSATAGLVTLTAPSTAGHGILKVGVVYIPSSGKIVIQFGDLVIL